MNQGPSWIGRTLNGRYQIEALLGQGRMSTVYRANDSPLKRAVAIRLFHTQLSNDPLLARDFEREVKAVAGLRHANIIQILDVNLAEGYPYIVMEYLSGPTLAAYLRNLYRKNERISTHQVARLLKELTSALDYAHELGVIHCDIKPENILLYKKSGEISIDEPLTSDVDAFLTGFALVRIIDSTEMTTSHMISGTPAYMAPEQARGDKTDYRTDIYSLGIVLYEMLAGHVPFESDSTLSIIYKHINEPPPAIPGISSAVQNVIDRALAKDPDERYQSSRDMAVDFYAAVGITTEAQTVSTGVADAVPHSDGGVGSRPLPTSARRSLLRTIFEFFIGNSTTRDRRTRPPIPKNEKPGTAPPTYKEKNSYQKRESQTRSDLPQDKERKYVEPKTGQPPPISSKESGDRPVDEVSFAAYHPKEGRVDTWYSLLVYAHVASALISVRQDAQRFDEQIRPRREITSKASAAIARGTQIPIVPTCNGITFNPERITFTWAETYHRSDFRFKADPSLADAAANGQISIHAGPLIIGCKVSQFRT